MISATLLNPYNTANTTYCSICMQRLLGNVATLSFYSVLRLAIMINGLREWKRRESAVDSLKSRHYKASRCAYPHSYLQGWVVQCHRCHITIWPSCLMVCRMVEGGSWISNEILMQMHGYGWLGRDVPRGWKHKRNQWIGHIMSNVIWESAVENVFW